MLKKRMNGSKIFKSGLITNTKLFPVAAAKDSRELNKKFINNPLDLKEGNKIVSKHSRKSSSDINLLNKKVFFSERNNNNNKSKNDENKRNTFKTIRSFSPKIFMENISPKSKMRNFSQSPNLKKYSKFKSQLNLSEILYLKKEKKSFDSNHSNKRKQSRNRASMYLNNESYDKFDIGNENNCNNININKQKGLILMRNYSEKINKDSKNLNLLFNKKDEVSNANLFLIVKNNPYYNKLQKKLNNLNYIDEILSDNINKNTKSDNNFKKLMSKGLVFKSNLPPFYETPVKKRLSRSANLKNSFNKANSHNKNTFQKILNEVKANTRSFNNPFFENDFDNQRTININKIKRCRRVLYDDSDSNFDNNGSKEVIILKRKLTLDDFILNSATNIYKDKNLNRLNFNNILLQSETSNLSFNSYFTKNNFRNNNGFANNPFILNNSNETKKNISNFDDLKSEGNIINNKENDFYQKNICDNINNTNLKTNFKSHLSNHNSAITFLNSETKQENFPINFGTTTDVKRNLNFNNVLRTENNIASKESLISLKSNNSKLLLNTSVISINQKPNNFLDCINYKKEDNKDLSENCFSKKSSSTFSDKLNPKSFNSDSFSINNNLNIRINFSEFFYNFEADEKHKSKEEDFNEIIMGDFNSIYEKINNKNRIYFYGLRNTPKKFDDSLLVEEMRFCFNYIKKDSKNKLSSLNSSFNLNISPKVPLKNRNHIEEDNEDIQDIIINSKYNLSIGKDKINQDTKNNDLNLGNNENFYEFDDVIMVQKNYINEISEEKKSISTINKVSNKSMHSHKSSKSHENRSFEVNDENLNGEVNDTSFNCQKDKQGGFIDDNNNLEKLNEIIKNDSNNFYSNFFGNQNSNNLGSQNLIEGQNPNYSSWSVLTDKTKGGFIPSDSPKLNNENITNHLNNHYINKINEIDHLNNYSEILRREYIKEIFFENPTINNTNINSSNNNKNFYNLQESQIPINQNQNASFFSQSVPAFSTNQNMLTSCLKNNPYNNSNNNNNNIPQNTIQILDSFNINNSNNNEVYFLNEYINSSISNFNPNLVLHSSQSTVNLNLPNSIYNSQTTNNPDNNHNNAYYDLQFSSSDISQDSTKINSTTQSTGIIDKELYPYIFNHKLLPPGKENDEVFKVKLANMIKNPKLTRYNSDFFKKRSHSQMLGYCLIAAKLNSPRLNQNSLSERVENLTSFNSAASNLNNENNNNSVNNQYALIANNIVFNQNVISKNAYNGQMLRICDESPFDFRGGIPEYKFNKYRKISSCKTNYSSFISFSNAEHKNVYFRIYRDGDLGFEEKYQKLTKIHVINLLIKFNLIEKMKEFILIKILFYL